MHTRHHVLPGILRFASLVCLLVPQAAPAQTSVEKLQEFPLDQVEITDAYQKNLFAKDVTYLITTIDTDRLIAGFKAVSQGTNPTNLYGGWENTNIRGHSAGHWLSAVARAYRQALGSDPTLAARIKTKLDDVTSKLKSYQLSSGYLFASPISEFDAFDNGTGGWVPYYTMHKILAGLIDVYKFEGNADALAVASKLGDWIYNRTVSWSSAAKSRVLGIEYGGLNDALYYLYKHTKSANHLTAAHVFDDTGLFTTAAAGTDNLSGKHANTTIPKFIGALNRYRTLGSSEVSYLNAASEFFTTVLKSHTYVTGGNSEDEHFHTPGALDQYRDNVNNETCNAYNMTKLTRDLFMVTGEIKYADFYERIHINEILSSINPDTGMTTYFKAMGTGYFKVFGSPTNHFWCCTGTGMENFTRLGDSVYFHDTKNLWATYYVSSTLNWKDRGLSLTQTTGLPLSNQVSFTIDSAPLDAVTINFRKPDWLAPCESMTLAVNDLSANATEANGFLGVTRVWQAGDRVELTIPAQVQVSRLQDNQNSVAFTYGPLVLSAGLGTSSMTTTSHGVQVLKATRPAGIQETITINGSTTINTWIANIKDNLVQTAGKLEFHARNTDSDSKLTFIPHFSRYQDRYGIYWKLAGTTGAAVSPPACPTTGGTSGTGGAGSTGGSGGRSSTSGGSSAMTGGGSSAMTGGAGGVAGLGGTTPASGGRSTGGSSSTSITGTGGIAGTLGGSASNTGGGSTINSTSALGGASQGGNGALGGTATNTNGSRLTGGKGNALASGGSGASTTSLSAGGTNIMANDQADQKSSGCSCKLSATSARAPWPLGLLLGLGMLARRRNQRARRLH